MYDEKYLNLLKNDDNKITGDGFLPTPQYPIYYFQLFLTYRCTRRCLYCYMYEQNVDKLLDMSDETFDKLCEWIPIQYNKLPFLHSTIIWVGGDHLLVTDKVKKLMDSVFNQCPGISSYMFTNGDLLHKINWDHMDKVHGFGLNITNVDLKEIQNRISIIEQHLPKKISKYNFTNSTMNTVSTTHIVATLDDFNLDRMGDIVRFGIETGHGLRFFRSSFNVNNEPYKEYLLKKLHSICDMLEHYKNHNYIINTVGFLDHFIPKRDLMDGIVITHCGNQSSVINPIGDVSICTFAVNTQETIVGNIFNNKSINESKKIRNSWACTPDLYDDCKDCKVRYICGGGCKHDNLKAYGKRIGKYPFCQIHKEIYPRLNELHDWRLM